MVLHHLLAADERLDKSTYNFDLCTSKRCMFV